MADYNRPAAGFRFENGGIKTNVAPDARDAKKFNLLHNLRSVTDTELQVRAGLSQLFSTEASPPTDIRAYTRLSTQNRPRLLSRNPLGDIWLDNGVQVGSLADTGQPGAAMIPFRPNESPNPYMYIANGEDYQKFSAPSAANAVTQQKVGIAEPQAPPGIGVSGQFQNFFGQPAGGTYANSGTAGSVTLGDRIVDSVVAVFTDPVSAILKTLQVAGAAGTVAPGIYLYGIVNAYFWPIIPGNKGAFGHPFPLDTSTADASAQGNSIRFNPTEFNGDQDPNTGAQVWGQVDDTGVITSYTIPYPAPKGYENYDMVVLAQLYVPTAGNYTLTITYDDGMIFAIAGASLISGVQNDPFYGYTRTAVQGLTFTNTSVAGSNVSGNHVSSGETQFVINFPTPGVYAMEIDRAQWEHEQNLNVFQHVGGSDLPLKSAGSPQSYQREMAIQIAGQLETVEDVFTALPQGLAISGIYYYSGTTGRCVVVPRSLSSGPGTEGVSLFTQATLASLRRGSLIKIGSEVCYVLSTSVGPDGTICFETTTTGAHTAAELLGGVPAIAVLGTGFAAGQDITSTDVQFGVTAGVGRVTSPVTVNPFVNSALSFQDEDYIHFSINVDNLGGFTEAKLMFDVGDGSFTRDFYFYTVRPSDIAAGVDNTLTQLGVAQLVAQRAEIDEARASAAMNQGVTFSGAQSSAGNQQWSEIKFAISELTRVGNAQDKSLQNVNSIALLVNASGTINIAYNSVTVKGGYSADVGPGGAPYLYRIRPRSTLTGVKGNPSPATRYGINPRRQRVSVVLPAFPPYDPQFNVWDIFRYGGSLTSWRFVGQQPVNAGTFIDNYGDDDVSAGAELEFDNFEPWPSIDLPYNITPGLAGGITTSVRVTGTTALVILSSTIAPITLLSSNFLNYLPGNLIRLGGQKVYTLWTRPTQVTLSSPPAAFYVAILFQLLENAGAALNPTLSIYEPAIANQMLPYMWGPDSAGTVFACGDQLRPGNVYFSKNYAPDSAPDAYNLEITAPSEPLLGGETLDGLSFVASTERWWAMYPQSQNPAQRYSLVQQPFPRGLAAPYGHCTDGAAIYWWAKDGIWSSEKGSLTDADLYNLFPHDGVAGSPYTYGGRVIQPPDYSRAGSFRLAKVNHYLYATYQDTNGTYRCLVYDTRRNAWSVDEYNPVVTTVYHPEQQEGTVGGATPALYPRAVVGTLDGVVAEQSELTNDLTNPIPCAVATMEWTGGDLRARELWGDFQVETTPNAEITVTPMSDRVQAFAPTVIPVSTARAPSLISLGGDLLIGFLGLMFEWTEDFTVQSDATVLFYWQPSHLPKPEDSGDRFTDWQEVQPAGAAGWVQGFVLHADTFGVDKAVVVRDSDTLTTHSYTPVINHNGESIKAYSFDHPFIAHQVRFEPQSGSLWRFWDAVIVAEPTPEVAETWETQGTAHGLQGYMHIKQVSIAYAASADVTLTITSYDGVSPVPITLPSTGGAYQKRTFILTFNKGMLYTYRAESPSQFQLYLPDCEILVGGWGRESPYLKYSNVGGREGDEAKV